MKDEKKQYLVQRNIWHEYGYDRFVQSILNSGHIVQEVNIIPFTEDFTETVRYIPDFIFGSTRFVNVCKHKGFPTYRSFSPLEHHYPKDLYVNGEGKLIKLGDIKNEDLEYPIFMKPITEKFFTGKLVECKEDLDKIQLASSFLPNEADELIWISDPKNIDIEYRFFVINNEIAAASSYKKHPSTQNFEIFPDNDAWIFTKELLKTYGGPDIAFCIDIGLTYNQYKIIELNNFNSSGIYACNTDNIVRYLNLL